MEGKRTGHLVYLVVLLISAVSVNSEAEILIEDNEDVIKIKCTGTTVEWRKDGNTFPNKTELALDYKDDNSGVYTCESDQQDLAILVKFRTCDNCVDLNIGTVVGIVVGEVVATVLIGVAVYLLASQSQGNVFRQANQASDRQNLIQNHQNDSTYQQLSPHGNSEYSHLEPRRGARKH